VRGVGRGTREPFRVRGRLAIIWNDRRLFLNWLRANHSLSRQQNPLSHPEARQIIANARRLKIRVDLNPTGLAGLERTGRWAGVPHFKIGRVHIPVRPGFRP
jgi:hypothetical protein